MGLTNLSQWNQRFHIEDSMDLNCKEGILGSISFSSFFLHFGGTILGWWVQMVKNSPAMQETWVQSLGWDDPLEERVATHSGILAWRIPGTGKPGGLLSMGSHRVGHNWSDSAAAAAATQVNHEVAWVSARHHVTEGFLWLYLQTLGVLRNMLLLFSY